MSYRIGDQTVLFVEVEGCSPEPQETRSQSYGEGSTPCGALRTRTAQRHIYPAQTGFRFSPSAPGRQSSQAHRGATPPCRLLCRVDMLRIELRLGPFPFRGLRSYDTISCPYPSFHHIVYCGRGMSGKTPTTYRFLRTSNDKTRLPD